MYLASQFPNAKSALALLTPNKADNVAPANQMFSLFLILVLYSLFYKNFLPSSPSYSFLKEDCPHHGVLHKICITLAIFFNHF